MHAVTASIVTLLQNAGIILVLLLFYGVVTRLFRLHHGADLLALLFTEDWRPAHHFGRRVLGMCAACLILASVFLLAQIGIIEIRSDVEDRWHNADYFVGVFWSAMALFMALVLIGVVFRVFNMLEFWDILGVTFDLQWRLRRFALLRLLAFMVGCYVAIILIDISPDRFPTPENWRDVNEQLRP